MKIKLIALIVIASVLCGCVYQQPLVKVYCPARTVVCADGTVIEYPACYKYVTYDPVPFRGFVDVGVKIK